MFPVLQNSYSHLHTVLKHVTKAWRAEWGRERERGLFYAVKFDLENRDTTTTTSSGITYHENSRQRRRRGFIVRTELIQSPPENHWNINHACVLEI